MHPVFGPSPYPARFDYRPSVTARRTIIIRDGFWDCVILRGYASPPQPSILRGRFREPCKRPLLPLSRRYALPITSPGRLLAEDAWAWRFRFAILIANTAPTKKIAAPTKDGGKCSLRP